MKRLTIAVLTACFMLLPFTAHAKTVKLTGLLTDYRSKQAIGSGGGHVLAEVTKSWKDTFLDLSVWNGMDVPVRINLALDHIYYYDYNDNQYEAQVTDYSSHINAIVNPKQEIHLDLPKPWHLKIEDIKMIFIELFSERYVISFIIAPE